MNETGFGEWLASLGQVNMEFGLLDLGNSEHLAHGILVSNKRVTFLSDEWADRTDQCKSFALSRLGKFKRRVGGRECQVCEIPLQEGRRFIDRYHLQGANRLTQVCFGLFLQDELLGVMSLGRHHRMQTKKHRVLLDRLCFQPEVQVVGGATKLLKVAVEWAKEHGYLEIVSFSDNRLSSGTVYEAMGFELEASLRRDYFYVRNGIRHSKQSQQKSATGCPPGTTEYEWAAQNGFVRSYDAGKKRWVLNLFPSTRDTRKTNSSKVAARLHESGFYQHHHIRGHMWSDKNKAYVYYASSYELRCMWDLENDASVLAYRRCSSFYSETSRKWRAPDLWVERAGGVSQIVEVKPKKMRSSAKSQISDTQEHASQLGAEFVLWTEDSAGMSEHQIIAWACDWLKENGNFSWSERKREQRKFTRDRRYAKIQADKVDVWCDFCKENHTQMRMTYDKNVKRNGKFICGKYGGHLAGQKPKDHLRVTNPYEEDGRKQCSKCREVKPFECFDKRSRSWDGYCASCKVCVSARNKARYKEAKNQSPN
jgi:GNAT superfamily N-acetyltransferase